MQTDRKRSKQTERDREKLQTDRKRQTENANRQKRQTEIANRQKATYITLTNRQITLSYKQIDRK